MQVAVIGGGIIGVSTAYFLSAAGHEVAVLERGNQVAEAGSFGNSGLVSPALAAPMRLPPRSHSVLSVLLGACSPVVLQRRSSPALWRWIRQWITESDPVHFSANKSRIHRLASYSRDVLEQIRLHYHLDYEQTCGHLHLLRTEQDRQAAETLLTLLRDLGCVHQLLDADATRQIEPALSANTTLAGALHLPQDEAGNCALFTRQLKSITQSMGVTFHFGQRVDQVSSTDRRLSLRLQDRVVNADSVVLAAGGDNLRLLGNIGNRIPALPMQSYSATYPIRDFDEAPTASLSDAASGTTLTRFGNRIRIAGVTEFGNRQETVSEKAQQVLHKMGSDWFPNASNYNQPVLWSTARMVLADGVPLVGRTPLRNVFVGFDDGTNGWTAALGIGKILSDLISDAMPDIDLDGLTLTRYGAS